MSSSSPSSFADSNAEKENISLFLLLQTLDVLLYFDLYDAAVAQINALRDIDTTSTNTLTLSNKDIIAAEFRSLLDSVSPSPSPTTSSIITPTLLPPSSPTSLSHSLSSSASQILNKIGTLSKRLRICSLNQTIDHTIKDGLKYKEFLRKEKEEKEEKQTDQMSSDPTIKKEREYLYAYKFMIDYLCSIFSLSQPISELNIHAQLFYKMNGSEKFHEIALLLKKEKSILEVRKLFLDNEMNEGNNNNNNNKPSSTKKNNNSDNLIMKKIEGKIDSIFPAIYEGGARKGKNKNLFSLQSLSQLKVSDPEELRKLTIVSKSMSNGMKEQYKATRAELLETFSLENLTIQKDKKQELRKSPTRASKRKREEEEEAEKVGQSKMQDKVKDLYIDTEREDVIQNLKGILFNDLNDPFEYLFPVLKQYCKDLSKSLSPPFFLDISKDVLTTVSVTAGESEKKIDFLQNPNPTLLYLHDGLFDKYISTKKNTPPNEKKNTSMKEKEFSYQSPLKEQRNIPCNVSVPPSLYSLALKELTKQSISTLNQDRKANNTHTNNEKNNFTREKEEQGEKDQENISVPLQEKNTSIDTPTRIATKNSNDSEEESKDSGTENVIEKTIIDFPMTQIDNTYSDEQQLQLMDDPFNPTSNPMTEMVPAISSPVKKNNISDEEARNTLRRSRNQLEQKLNNFPDPLEESLNFTSPQTRKRKNKDKETETKSSSSNKKNNEERIISAKKRFRSSPEKATTKSQSIEDPSLNQDDKDRKENVPSQQENMMIEEKDDDDDDDEQEKESFSFLRKKRKKRNLLSSLLEMNKEKEKISGNRGTQKITNLSQEEVNRLRKEQREKKVDRQKNPPEKVKTKGGISGARPSATTIQYSDDEEESLISKANNESSASKSGDNKYFLQVTPSEDEEDEDDTIQDSESNSFQFPPLRNKKGKKINGRKHESSKQSTHLLKKLAQTKESSVHSRCQWSQVETDTLIRAVDVDGLYGNWSLILSKYRNKFHHSRDNVALKDKWRNIERKRNGR